MVSEHRLHFSHDVTHRSHIVISNTHRLVDPAVQHARGILDGHRRKHRVGHIQWALIEGANARHAPTDILHRTLKLAVRGSDPVANRKGAIEENTQTTEKVCQ